MKTENEALRFNEGKVDPTNIHPSFFMYLARVGNKGMNKYGKFNYLKGGKPASEYLASGFRHFMKLMGGELKDPETGEHHASHIAWNMLMLAWAVDSGLSEFDSAPTKDMEKFLDLFNT